MTDAAGDDQASKPLSKRDSLFGSFAIGATILGFVVDSIAIVTILLSLNLSQQTPQFITPGLAFAIWILAVFSYFGYLHSYWLKNRGKYDVDFSIFVIQNLILDFESPKHLLPMVVLIIMFFPT